MAPNVQTKILRKARTPEEYTVYLATLEWDLIDPIVIENREDVKSEATWLGRLTPYNHQVTNLITYCRRLPVGCEFVEFSSGARRCTIPRVFQWGMSLKRGCDSNGV